MCRAVNCRVCGKTSWAGCGQHVDQVLRGIPVADRCPGHAKEASDKSSFLGRILRRR